MDWLYNLFFDRSVTHSLLIIALTIFCGIFLGQKLKLKGVSIGSTWILFCGIAFSHFGMRLDPQIEQFAKDFGLILFVYSIGLQVGPSFFSSFSKGGLRLNMLACCVVILGCVVTYVLYLCTDIDMPIMVGIMSGAVTNTPGLGAAQQAYAEISGVVDSNIATGYAVAYPLGVVGIILSLIIIKLIFRIKYPTEEKHIESQSGQDKEVMCVDVQITNQRADSITIHELAEMCNIEFIVSRIIHPDGKMEVANGQSVVHLRDVLRILVDKKQVKTLTLLGNPQAHTDKVNEQASNLISRRIVVTKPEWNGKRIDQLNVPLLYHVTITRVNRAGIDLLATHNLYLQLGDRVTVVGEEENVKKVADFFGNSMKKLNLPNLLPIFLGIFIGILFGSIPFRFPGMSQAFKLGLAGGSLIIAILISRYGPYYKMVTFTTTSANMMVREIGISLFLAAVGLGVGENFIPTIAEGGYMWILYGFIITILPVMLVGCFARKYFKLDYYSLMGFIAGSTTDPPALAYAVSVSSNNDCASVAYATVYPLTMFLRVMLAQLMIMFFV